MSQQTCTSELLRVKQGETLNLPCQSHCSGEPVYSWWRVTEEEGDGRDLLELTGSTLTKNPVHVHDGGQYVCKCDGPECWYNVSSELQSQIHSSSITYNSSSIKYGTAQMLIGSLYCSSSRSYVLC